ncbi:MAG: restriction endonuclease subunit S [Bacillaceae bacterium]|nr:restriction endonuclease subunit S [Bacillaceae bacterium]
MKLSQIAQFTQGAFTNRLEKHASHIETTKRKKCFRSNNFNETLGLNYRISNEKSTEITVPKQKLIPQLLTDTTSLILHTHTQKVALLPEKYSGLLLTNNFIKIELTDDIDASFFEWYFNEHPYVQKQLSVLSEGTFFSTLKLSHLKELEIELPPIQKQVAIGRIAHLKKVKGSLMTEKRELQQIYLQQKLVEGMNTINQI